MKQLAFIILSFVVFAAANVIQPGLKFEKYNTAYGYLNKIGIPAAERIEKAENQLLSSRISNGSPAEVGQFKYQAGLIGEFADRPNRTICGAVLVNDRSLLTAAHCWTDGESQVYRYTVVLGSILLFSGGLRVQTNDVVVHPNWFPLLIRNDIAVVRMPEPVPLSSLIQPIRLPRGLQIFENYAGEVAQASGFGVIGDNATISDDQYLSHGRMTVLEHSQCLNFFPSLIFQNSNICTRTVLQSSTCGGDSGGPLVVERDGEPLLIGLTSFGLVWCSIGWPAAFVRVSSFITFINQNI